MARMDINAGGYGVWLREAWQKGPNAVDSSVTSENDISELIKCPVWDPEIVRGGICPIGHPGE